MLALLSASALAGGGGPRLSPLGAAYSDPVTLPCRSGRRVLFFSPNAQSVRLLYRGKVSSRSYPVQKDQAHARDLRYADVGLPGMGAFDTPRLGEGLEWRSLAQSGPAWAKSELYRVVQRADGRRNLTLLERCSGWLGSGTPSKRAGR